MDKDILHAFEEKQAGEQALKEDGQTMPGVMLQHNPLANLGKKDKDRQNEDDISLLSLVMPHTPTIF